MNKTLTVIFVLLFFSCTAQKNANQTTAANYFESLFKKGDFAAISKMITPNAVYNQAAGLPYGGTFTGFNEWMKMFGKVQEYIGLELVDEPVFFSNYAKDKIIANFKIKFTAKKSGAQQAMSIAELLEFDNGKISRISPYYFDTKTLVDFINK